MSTLMQATPGKVQLAPGESAIIVKNQHPRYDQWRMPSLTDKNGWAPTFILKLKDAKGHFYGAGSVYWDARCRLLEDPRQVDERPTHLIAHHRDPFGRSPESLQKEKMRRFVRVLQWAHCGEKEGEPCPYLEPVDQGDTLLLRHAVRIWPEWYSVQVVAAGMHFDLIPRKDLYWMVYDGTFIGKDGRGRILNTAISEDGPDHFQRCFAKEHKLNIYRPLIRNQLRCNILEYLEHNQSADDKRFYTWPCLEDTEWRAFSPTGYWNEKDEFVSTGVSGKVRWCGHGSPTFIEIPGRGKDPILVEDQDVMSVPMLKEEVMEDWRPRRVPHTKDEIWNRGWEMYTRAEELISQVDRLWANYERLFDAGVMHHGDYDTWAARLEDIRTEVAGMLEEWDRLDDLTGSCRFRKVWNERAELLGWPKVEHLLEDVSLFALTGVRTGLVGRREENDWTTVGKAPPLDQDRLRKKGRGVSPAGRRKRRKAKREALAS